MGIPLWLWEVFQHNPDGQQSCLPCWIIERRTHACGLWQVDFRQVHLLIFLVHIIARGYFPHFSAAPVLQGLSGVTYLKTVGEIPS